MRKISLAKAIILLFLIPFCLYLFFKIHSFWTGRISDENLIKQKEEKEISRVEQFEMKGLELGREAFTLKAKKFSQLKEGVSLLQDINPFTLTTTQGKKITLSGEQGVMVESKGKQAKIIIEGDVTIQTEDGQELKTKKITYDALSKKVYADSEVTFSGPGFHGKASRMNYSIKQEVIKLAPHFDLWLDRENGNIRIQAASFEGDLDLKRGFLKGGVALRDHQNEILAKEAILIENSKKGQWREVQLLGGVLGLSHQEKAAQKSLARFEAERMNIFINEQKMIDKIIMEGSISVVLENEQNPTGSYKKLNSDRLVAIWQGGNISEITAEGNVHVEMVSQSLSGSESPETLFCHVLTIYFNQDGTIKQARAFDDIMFQSGSTRGSCEEAEYNSAKKQIIMREKKNRPPYLSIEVWSVYAQEIVIKDRDEISASGTVKTLYIEKDCQDCNIPLFRSDQSVFISSDALDISEGKEAIYSGNVRAWQGENSIEAQKVHILFKNSIFKAHGEVISRFYNLFSKNAYGETNKVDSEQDPHQRIEVQSEDLIYLSEEHKATYKGDVVLHMKESKMTCSEMDILFSEEGQAEKIKAKSDILMKSRDFQAEGDLLEYLLSERSGYLNGTSRPARAYSKSGKEMIVGASLTFKMGEDNINLLSRDEGRTWMIFK